MKKLAWIIAVMNFCTLAICEDYSSYDRKNYVQYLSPNVVKKIVERLPSVDDENLSRALKDSSTMWYDEESMVYVYQDSVETVVGLRANRVGRETGENSSVPDIRLLMNYFGPDKKFRFPFRTAAGTDESPGVKVVNFWKPASQDGKVLPVKWWKASNRGRWHWIHPVGTLFGEVLMIQDEKGEFYPFEIRTRTRYLQGWDVNVFRPFQFATQLVDKIKSLRPDWRQSSTLAKALQHLQNPDTVKPFTLSASDHLKPTFEEVNGALDLIPDFGDNNLVRELLTTTSFKTVEGRIWRENDKFETYAPSSSSAFSIVPQNYTIGVIPVNEISCARCHDQTGRALKDFEFRVQLYGEVWGEDNIFTWHLFKDNPHIYGTFDDSDGSRFINPRLVQAGLVSEGKPSEDSNIYRWINKWKIPN